MIEPPSADKTQKIQRSRKESINRAAFCETGSLTTTPIVPHSKLTAHVLLIIILNRS